MKLIDKDALVAEIDKKLSYYKDLEGRGLLSKEGDAAFRAVRILKSDINFLEVKEVDLEKEIKDYFNNQPIITKSKGVDYQLIPSGEKIAKHFFELGLKAQKNNIRHSMDETPNYPCNILFVTDVDNIFLFRYMENGRPVDRETLYFHNIQNGKCWYYCDDIVNIQ